MINSIGNTNCQVEELKYTGYPSDIINSIKIKICQLNVCDPSFPGSDKIATLVYSSVIFSMLKVFSGKDSSGLWTVDGSQLTGLYGN